MLTRRTLLAAVFAVAMPDPVGPAAGAQPFGVVAFAEAQRQGKPILVAIDARWCPICLVQRTVLWALLRDERYSQVNYLVVDFDTAANLARSFGARFQSTLIVFKGGAERGRAVGETNDRAIAELLDRIV